MHYPKTLPYVPPDCYTQMPAKKKPAIKTTIMVPSTTKSKPGSVDVPIDKAEGSIPKATPRFHWTELDIPFQCPSSDCTHAVPSDLPLSVTALFRDWSQAIYDHGRTAIEVLRLETHICLEVAYFRIVDRARRFAKDHGFADVNLPAVPERILRWEKDILLLVSDKHHRDSCFSWMNLLDELKMANSSLEALEKGKSVPSEIAEQVRPG